MTSPRLCKTFYGPVTKRPITWLFCLEEEELRIAMKNKLPHIELMPLLTKAREKRKQYDEWTKKWDDPCL